MSLRQTVKLAGQYFSAARRKNGSCFYHFSVVLSSAKQSWSFQNFIDFPGFFSKRRHYFGVPGGDWVAVAQQRQPSKIALFGCFKRSRPIAFLVSYREAFESTTTAARRFSDLGVALFEIG